MKKSLLLLLIITSFYGCNNNPSKQSEDKSNLTKNISSTEENSKNNIKNILKKTVSISMFDANRQPLSYGSGIIVEDGVIATNLHVLENATSGKVNFEGENFDINGYIAVDRLNDIVLISVPIKEKGVNFYKGEISAGDKIFVAGNPVGLEKTLSDGIVSNPNRILNGKNLIQISAPISPGSSGGPVTNEIGELIGVACGSLTNGQNLNFAVPLNFLTKLLNSKNIIRPLDFKASKKTTNVNLNNDYKSWIKIRNISSINTTEGSEFILCFSIYNKTEYIVSNLKILLIAYDREGIPTDYQTYSFFNQGVLPGLSKEVERVYAPNKYIEKPLNGKVEYRVLSYDIQN